jgi:hypothetical protein
MGGFYSKDPEVRRLAGLLAARRNTTPTDAVLQALREAFERDPSNRVGMAEVMLSLAAEFRARGGTALRADDLYDERGLPR